ncbi:hypothetical protein PIB30_055182 [Stylosanthes scabra]|uniref:Uncharacterized protein n=1 Tax=Stylosanthes scabra TaxID=79078 RepID=A0ABU6XKJ6_9FABA|nr:hypothetical protein [Stylosanthes scabra]
MEIEQEFTIFILLENPGTPITNITLDGKNYGTMRQYRAEDQVTKFLRDSAQGKGREKVEEVRIRLEKKERANHSVHIVVSWGTQLMYVTKKHGYPPHMKQRNSGEAAVNAVNTAYLEEACDEFRTQIEEADNYSYGFTLSQREALLALIGKYEVKHVHSANRIVTHQKSQPHQDSTKQVTKNTSPAHHRHSTLHHHIPCISSNTSPSESITELSTHTITEYTNTSASSQSIIHLDQPASYLEPIVPEIAMSPLELILPEAAAPTPQPLRKSNRERKSPSHLSDYQCMNISATPLSRYSICQRHDD